LARLVSPPPKRDCQTDLNARSEARS